MKCNVFIVYISLTKHWGFRLVVSIKKLDASAHDDGNDDDDGNYDDDDYDDGC